VGRLSTLFKTVPRGWAGIFTPAAVDYPTFDSLTLPDAGTLIFGDGSDVSLQWDGTNLLMSAAADDSLFEIGDSAVTQKSFDLKWYGGQASGASYLFADASADLIYTVGVDLQFKDADLCVFGTGAGAAGDVSITWDGTNLIVNAVADDTLIEIGDSAATQKSFDLKWYGNEASGASFLYFDASANLLYTTDIDVQFLDNDLLVFGTGAGGTGDVQLRWDATDLDLLATADDTVFKIGNGTNSFDLWVYGNVATDYILWDASASLLSFAGVAAQGVTNRSIGASTAALGTNSGNAAVLPAGTAPVYPTTAADDTVGVRIHASDQITGRTLFIGNGVSNKILKVYPPTGGVINGAAADAAFSSDSGKGVVIMCLSSGGNTWLAF
jgi:hypothetical protein